MKLQNLTLSCTCACIVLRLFLEGPSVVVFSYPHIAHTGRVGLRLVETSRIWFVRLRNGPYLACSFALMFQGGSDISQHSFALGDSYIDHTVCADLHFEASSRHRLQIVVGFMTWW